MPARRRCGRRNPAESGQTIGGWRRSRRTMPACPGGRPAGRRCRIPCRPSFGTRVRGVSQTNSFTDSRARTILYRYSIDPGWNAGDPRGVLIYFHGNDTYPSRQDALDAIFPFVEPRAFSHGLIPVVVVSPETPCFRGRRRHASLAGCGPAAGTRTAAEPARRRRRDGLGANRVLRRLAGHLLPARFHPRVRRALRGRVRCLLRLLHA